MHHITTPEQMIEFWVTLAKEHKILLLHWELGAGKTLLTKGFAQGLWLNPNAVQSPTYAYLNIYESNFNHQGNQWNAVSLDDWIMPTIWETASINEVKWLQISKTVGRKLLHIDMYRIKNYNELVEKWIIDQINEFEYIVIERPKFIDQLPFKDSTTIHIKKNSENERTIEISS